jgi:hypothetical protein
MRVDTALPIVMAGMVGSASGWQETPYLDLRIALEDLPRHLLAVRDSADCWIVPGYASGGPDVDVMRGEETQLLARWCWSLERSGRLGRAARHPQQMGVPASNGATSSAMHHLHDGRAVRPPGQRTARSAPLMKDGSGQTPVPSPPAIRRGAPAGCR